MLVTCSYKGQEFVRVGYYVNNAYTDPEMQENPPEKHKLEAVSSLSLNKSHLEGSGWIIGLVNLGIHPLL